PYNPDQELILPGRCYLIFVFSCSLYLVDLISVKVSAFFRLYGIQVPDLSTNIPDLGLSIHEGMNKAVILKSDKMIALWTTCEDLKQSPNTMRSTIMKHFIRR